MPTDIDSAAAAVADPVAQEGPPDIARLMVQEPESRQVPDGGTIFAEITELAAYICDVPFALINLAQYERDGFKSVYDRTGELINRDMSNEVPGRPHFCDLVMATAEPLEIADAAHDVRFFNDPLVGKNPGIRFYAGMPLMSNSGQAIGTLCVLGKQPKSLSHSQRTALSQLANVVMRLVDARRHQKDVARLGAIVDKSLNEIIVFDDETNFVLYANEGACRNLGYSLDELRTMNATHLSTDWNVSRREMVRAILKSGERASVSVEIEARRKDGTTYPSEAWVQQTDQFGRPGFIVMANDISARKAAEEALYQEKELAEITLESIGDAVLTTDAQGMVTYLNPVAQKLCGWKPEDAMGMPAENVFRIISEKDRQTLESPIDRVLSQGQTSGLANHTVLVSKLGEEFAIEDSAAPIRARDGKLVGAVLVFRDVTHTRQMARNLSWQASHDALTDLVNRREFESMLGTMLHTARTRSLHHAMLYIDLDQFKVVNDTCGHQAGDELLRQLSAILMSSMRQSDLLARLGGDEFGVLLDGCNIGQAERIAVQILDAIRAFRFSWQGRLFSISASIGVCAIDADCKSVEAAMSAADTACFMAKDKGRNQVQVFRMDDEEVSSRQGEMSWVSRLVKCADEDRFFLNFQRVQALGQDDGRLHQEVLLRMKDETGRTVPPMAFIPAAERYNLMPTIDRWVFRRMTTCLARCLTGPDAAIYDRLQLAVNVSGVSLSDERLLDFILAQFDETGVRPDRFCFEITETAAISNLTRVTRFMHRLKSLGCRFALDDFGSGLSSFAYLKNLPVDYLKIDGVFIKGTPRDAADYAMVESINRVGHVMGMQTVAEFVEDEDILRCMREIGVDYVQGHHIHQPEGFKSLICRLRGESVGSLAACA